MLNAAVTTSGGDTIVLGWGQCTVTRETLPAYGQFTIEGQDMAQTWIVGAGNFDLVEVKPLGALTLDGLPLSSPHQALKVSSGVALLRFVRVPAG